MLNNVCVMGRLVTDPELKQTPSGTSVCNFTLAVQRDYAPSGEEKIVDFLDFVVWDKKAEFFNKFFTKGQLTVAEGELQTRTYKDKNDLNHKVSTIVVRSLHFAGKKNESGAA